jgi:hypothetical protein
MNLVTSFLVMLQPLAVAMTAPTFCNWTTLLAGWAFAPRRTVTGMLLAAGAVGKKHHSAFHRLFAQAQWSLDHVGLLVFDMLAPWLEGDIFVVLDDTLARKRGLKMFGVGMHHDPLLSTRRTAVMNWGHSWVVLGVIVRFKHWPERAFCLPILFRLYLNKKSASVTAENIARAPSWPWRCCGLCAGTEKIAAFTCWPIVPTAGRACWVNCRRTVI